MKSLDDYLKYMKTNDVAKATQEARTNNAALLNDQGIAAIAILFSDVLAEVIIQISKINLRFWGSRSP